VCVRAMSTSLGWRDVGAVLLSKAEDLRRRGDERRGGDRNRSNNGEGGEGGAAVFHGAVMSRRTHRSSRIDKDLEKDKRQAESFSSQRDGVLDKRPESRLKWLHEALVLVGKKQLKVVEIYDLVVHKKFASGANDKVGGHMKQLLLSNLHLFSSKQQKFLQSDECALNAYPTPVAPPRPAAEAKKRRRGGDADSSSSDDEDDEQPPPRTRARREGSPHASSRGDRHRGSGGGSDNRRGGEHRHRDDRDRRGDTTAEETTSRADTSGRVRDSGDRSKDIGGHARRVVDTFGSFGVEDSRRRQQQQLASNTTFSRPGSGGDARQQQPVRAGTSDDPRISARGSADARLLARIFDIDA